MTLQSRFHRNLAETCRVSAGSRLLVALSGGADSIALFSLVLESAPALELEVEAAHLDHALRTESQRDAEFVASLCAERGVLLTSRRVDVAGTARQKKGNLEEVAREMRREFLIETSRKRGCDLVAIGHHADDQAETFMMRLLRGAGPGGLAAMCPVDGQIIRPLLPFRKSELLDYLAKQGLCWRDDESNRDHSFTRNRIRHQLMPLLESFNPRMVTQLAGLCERFRQDENGWNELVRVALEDCTERFDDELRVNCEKLNRQPRALAGRLVRAALRDVRGDLRGVNARHVAAVLALAADGPVQGEVSLPQTWVARRYEILRLRQARPLAEEPFELTLSHPGDYSLPEGMILRVSREEQAVGEGMNAVEFNESAVPLPLRLRHVRRGDRIRPAGLGGSKKLQDLFVDLKMTREERRSALVLCREEEILWVAGLRRCEGHRPEAGSPVLRAIIIPAAST